jgi:hypothetical protein
MDLPESIRNALTMTFSQGNEDSENHNIDYKALGSEDDPFNLLPGSQDNSGSIEVVQDQDEEFSHSGSIEVVQDQDEEFSQYQSTESILQCGQVWQDRNDNTPAPIAWSLDIASSAMEVSNAIAMCSMAGDAASPPGITEDNDLHDTRMNVLLSDATLELLNDSYKEEVSNVNKHPKDTWCKAMIEKDGFDQPRLLSMRQSLYKVAQTCEHCPLGDLKLRRNPNTNAGKSLLHKLVEDCYNISVFIMGGSPSLILDVLSGSSQKGPVSYIDVLSGSSQIGPVSYIGLRKDSITSTPIHSHTVSKGGLSTPIVDANSPCSPVEHSATDGKFLEIFSNLERMTTLVNKQHAKITEIDNTAKLSIKRCNEQDRELERWKNKYSELQKEQDHELERWRSKYSELQKNQEEEIKKLYKIVRAKANIDVLSESEERLGNKIKSVESDLNHHMHLCNDKKQLIEESVNKTSKSIVELNQKDLDTKAELNSARKDIKANKVTSSSNESSATSLAGSVTNLRMRIGVIERQNGTNIAQTQQNDEVVPDRSNVTNPVHAIQVDLESDNDNHKSQVVPSKWKRREDDVQQVRRQDTEPQERRLKYYIGNIEDEVTEYDIRSFLRSYKIHPTIMTLRANRSKTGYLGAKVHVKECDSEKILDKDIEWPGIAYIRPWNTEP